MMLGDMKVCATLFDLVLFEFVLKKKIQKKGKNWEQIAADFKKKFPVLQSLSARTLEQRYKAVEDYWNNREGGQSSSSVLEAVLQQLRKQRIKYLQYVIENINLLCYKLLEDDEIIDTEADNIINQFVFSSKLDLDNVPPLTQEALDEIFSTASRVKVQQQLHQNVSTPSNHLDSEEIFLQSSTPKLESEELQSMLPSPHTPTTRSVVSDKRPFESIDSNPIEELEGSKKQKLVNSELIPQSSLFQSSSIHEDSATSSFASKSNENT